MEESRRIKCACGCIVEQSTLIVKKVRFPEYSTTRKVCPHHGTFPEGRQLFRLYNCSECGKECKALLNQPRSHRCKACQEIATEEARKKSNEIRLRQQKILIDKKRKAKKHTKTLKNLPYKTIEQCMLEHPDNTFNCYNFHLCGLCIKPYFECKMFKPS